MQLSPVKLSQFNIMLHQQPEEPLEARLISRIRNTASTSQALDKTFMFLLQSSLKIKSQNISMIYILQYDTPFETVIHSLYFKNSFFPSDINKWNKLNPKIRNSSSREQNLQYSRPFRC